MKTTSNKVLFLCLILFFGSLSAQAQNTRGFSKRTTTYSADIDCAISIGGGLGWSRYIDYYWECHAKFHIGLKQNFKLLNNKSFSIILNEFAEFDELYEGEYILTAGLEYQTKLNENMSLFAEASLGPGYYFDYDDIDLYFKAGIGILFNNNISLSAQFHFSPSVSRPWPDHYEYIVYPCIQLGYYIF